jgi:hypothetical protein
VRADGLLLRYAEALQKQHSPLAARHIGMLEDRFAAAMKRGDSVHQREQARFSLHLQHNAREALRLAQQNWSGQMEPADARILLEAAMAAGDADAIRTITDWIAKNRLQDATLSAIAKRTGA